MSGRYEVGLGRWPVGELRGRMGMKIEDVAGMRDKEGKKQVMMIELEGREAGVEEAISGTGTSRFGAKACTT